MISTLASQATSLFQYIDDQRSSAQFVEDMGKLTSNASANHVDEIQNGLVSISNIDAMVDEINKRESDVSTEKVSDMLSFYYQQVSSETSETAAGYGVSNVAGLVQVDGEWQFEGNNTPSKQEQNFLNHLNKDSRLGERLDKVLKLSELNEKLTARDSAQTLKNNDVADSDIESYLIATADAIQSNRYLSLEQGSLKIGSAGLANEFYKQRFDEDTNN